MGRKRFSPEQIIVKLLPHLKGGVDTRKNLQYPSGSQDGYF